MVDDINRQLMAPLSPQEIALLDDMLARMQQRAGELAAGKPDLPRANRRKGAARPAA